MRSLIVSFVFILHCNVISYADHIRDLQTEAMSSKKADWGHWGVDPDVYDGTTAHSNRLIPVYAFGTQGTDSQYSLKPYQQPGKSPYASTEKLTQLFGQVPDETHNPNAVYFDQTNIYDIQKAALDAGKKHIILFVFDGFDWMTAWKTAIHQSQKIGYTTGRGDVLHLQNYTAHDTTEFGWMVTTPWCYEAETDVNSQTILNLNKSTRGGYAFRIAGCEPWSQPTDVGYLLSESTSYHQNHAFTDSASSASSMNSGIKTYNASINIDIHGNQAETIAHLAQQNGYRIGVVTSVQISHATPAATYAHNVSRVDSQDLTRDLLGLPSISHPEQPLPGVDLLIGCGHGQKMSRQIGQGDNFIPGNPSITDEDLLKVDVRNGGKYVVAQRTAGVVGAMELEDKCHEAIRNGHRLFGFYGTSYGHLPYQTADGQYDPTIGRTGKAETYTEADLKENPLLSDMTKVALDYLSHAEQPFWLMVEAGDVDWANHDNNIDNSIGAVLSGDAAVKVITDWVEENSSWDETVIIITGDHGHYFWLNKPEALLPQSECLEK